MEYYRGKYRGARKQWLDLAEQEAHKRELEFERDNEQEAFVIPHTRSGRVRASLDQRPRIQLIVDDEMNVIENGSDYLGSRILLVVLLIKDSDRFDPDVDEFIPIRDTLLTGGKHTTERSDGKTQLNINVNETPFKNRKNKWEWVFEK